ncbi:MAG: hypothetical protein AB1757_15610 [Acidobacteriota bacterium]
MKSLMISKTFLLLFIALFGLSALDVNAQTRRTRPRTRRAPVAKPKTTTPPATTTTTTPTETKKAETPKPPEKKSEPEEKPEPILPGPTIWRNPGKVEKLDFQYGKGGAANAPLPPFNFIEEDKSGSNPKVKVKDANGKTWGVKWGSEVHSEVFASKLVWAAGYYVEPAFFLKSGKIIGAINLTRAAKYIAADGSFKDARFELKESGIKKMQGKESWLWDKNPFLGTKELNGLKIMIMLTSNWDSKDQRDASRGSNTAIFKVKATGEERFLMTDWGGSMGKWGGVFSREKWDCDGFAKQSRDFIKGVKNGFIEFGYKGQRTDEIRTRITPADAKWLLQYIGKITDAQLRTGLQASAATPEEVECFTRAIMERISQLKRIAE